jgi:hypothetical protein
MPNRFLSGCVFDTIESEGFIYNPGREILTGVDGGRRGDGWNESS